VTGRKILERERVPTPAPTPRGSVLEPSFPEDRAQNYDIARYLWEGCESCFGGRGAKHDPGEILRYLVVRKQR
jgi:hypothetical protein